MKTIEQIDLAAMATIKGAWGFQIPGLGGVHVSSRQAEQAERERVAAWRRRNQGYVL